jgi:hypothetical protein
MMVYSSIRHHSIYKTGTGLYRHVSGGFSTKTFEDYPLPTVVDSRPLQDPLYFTHRSINLFLPQSYSGVMRLYT